MTTPHADRDHSERPWWPPAATFGLPEHPTPKPPPPFVIDAAHLTHQREWSAHTFGPGPRLAGVLDHIRDELLEVEADPDDVTEWADILILAFDGALRAGHTPQDILDAVHTKQLRNEARAWPDWRTQPADRRIEHLRIPTPGNTPNTPPCA